MATTIDDKMVQKLGTAIASMNEALTAELTKKALATSFQEMVDSTPADISARYWLMQVLDPLTNKDLKSIVNGFLVQLLSDDQAKMLVKFVVARYPGYYKQEQPQQEQPKPEPSVVLPKE